jgi:hypothetical protein
MECGGRAQRVPAAWRNEWCRVAERRRMKRDARNLSRRPSRPIVKIAIFSVIVGLLPFAGDGAPNAEPVNAPGGIRELASRIQGKKPDEIRTAIIERFGKAQRNVGSGFRIEQWDVPGGVLTFHPATGPSFSDGKTGKILRLLVTKNPVGPNILAGFEMTTIADPKNHGNRFWIGNVRLGEDSSYRYEKQGEFEFANKHVSQADNFFVLHPEGTVEVRYVAPITADTLLESVPEGATVAHMIFTAADRGKQAAFAIQSSEQNRRLVFTSDKPLPFALETSWQSFWR